MNFEKIPSVEDAEEILEIAFRKARIRGRQKSLEGNWLQIIRKKESLKLDLVKDSIENSLQKIIKYFPDLKALQPFYLKLLALTLDLNEFKKSLGAINWTIQKNRELHRQAVRNIYQETNREKIKKIIQGYYGRISSILKQVHSHLDYLEKCRRIMRSYPDIKEAYTICIYGFPNVGKTTLLNNLTKTKAKVAAYAFTTKSINAGYLDINEKKVQILDVPGTLAREKLNAIEKQAQLVVTELADLIIYVYDVTESCGYSLEKQQQLLQQLKKQLPDTAIIVYFSKSNIMTEKDLAKIEGKIYSLEEIKAEITQRV